MKDQDLRLDQRKRPAHFLPTHPGLLAPVAGICHIARDVVDGGIGGTLRKVDHAHARERMVAEVLGHTRKRLLDEILEEIPHLPSNAFTHDQQRDVPCPGQITQRVCLLPHLLPLLRAEHVDLGLGDSASIDGARHRLRHIHHHSQQQQYVPRGPAAVRTDCLVVPLLLHFSWLHAWHRQLIHAQALVTPSPPCFPCLLSTAVRVVIATQKVLR
mmetsp:Transcript_36162/g.85745  ORF Transcript_36162/g.85745 Transcript_36162/m.85745 type:complete len:214 (+) Transcript_36162:294-935(+)